MIRAKAIDMRYEPTLEEIQQRCQEIQETWSDGERRRREVIQYEESWQPPVISLPEVSSSADVPV